MERSVEIALRYGMIDGCHHKQWVIDQMLREILGDKYDEVLKEYNADQDYETWDIGIEP
jgi:hypothetical protein